MPRVPARAAQGGALAAETRYWGAEDYAGNFLIKAMVLAQKRNVRQMYVYQPSDEYNEDGTECFGQMPGATANRKQPAARVVVLARIVLKRERIAAA